MRSTHYPCGGSSARAVMLTAFMATCLAPASHAATFPDYPLQTGVDRPYPNIWFILDDSGSMTWDFMPDTVDRRREYLYRNHVTNSVHYNPRLTYSPWQQADGTPISGGQEFGAAYGGDSTLDGTVDLGDDTRVYYAPKSADTQQLTTNYRDFYRFEIIRGKKGVMRIERCEFRGGWWNDNCVDTTEVDARTHRTLPAEIANYATWYSFHRTRMKAAKAAVSAAFSKLGGNYRVGFDTIWNRSPFPIPVGTDEGRFDGSNRSTWFARVHASQGEGRTPLHGALDRAGRYFQDDGASGPWGPEAGDAQVSCRRNFAILTTDGFWNDTSGYTTPVGNADGSAGALIQHANGKSSYRYTPSRPYSDTYSDTLADVAMHYWRTDLRPDLANNVPASNANPAFWQSMVTFGLSIGLKGTLDPKADLPALRAGTKQWPDANAGREGPHRIDDLWHAAVDSRGAFVAASSPDEFREGLSAALGRIQGDTGSGSNVSTNSTTFHADSRVYQASYVSQQWHGELAAYSVSAGGIKDEPDWRASTTLRADGRKVLTWNGSQGASFPTSAQEAALARTGTDAPVTGTENAAYLKGDQRLEANGRLRPRQSLLGDIVNSSPVYAKEVDGLFVGANDGMLHAFDATDGTEWFAYVPAGVDFAALAELSHPDYRHRFFVDGPLSASTARLTPGKTLLVGTLGRGGKGAFALDASKPSAFNAARDVLWDRTATSDPDMGHVLGEPLLATTDAGHTVAIIANGIDSTNGSATLFVHDLQTGTVLARLVADTGSGNGLFAPRGADLDGNGTLDRVYAGDLKGNLWRFDLAGTAAADWKVANAGAPLFRARDVGGNPQPITGGIGLAREPLTQRVWVTFGTGRFLSEDDSKDTATQSLYGLYDDGSAVGSRTALVARSFTVHDASLRLRGIEAHGALPQDKRGWVIDLGVPSPQNDGERVVATPLVRGRAAVIASIIPASGNRCAPGGRGYLNAVDVFTGTALPGSGGSSSYFDLNGNGRSDDDVLSGTDGQKHAVGSVDVGVGMPTNPNQVENLLVVGGSTGERGSVPTQPGSGGPRRVLWRERYER